MLRAVLIALGAVLIADTVLVAMAGNMNLGVVLPALIGLPLLVVGLFYAPALRFFATPAGRWVQGALIGGYALFAISFVVVAAQITGYLMTPPKPDADAVIVLGAAVRGRTPSLTLAARLDCAYDYLVQNPETRVIVTGGQGPGEDVTEASAMKEYLVQKGIAPQRIYEEGRSTSTLENLQNAREILNSEFDENPRLVLVSSDYHLYRAQLVARKLGMEVETLGSSSIPWLLPNFYLREYVAVLGYRFLGRLG